MEKTKVEGDFLRMQHYSIWLRLLDKANNMNRILCFLLVSLIWMGCRTETGENIRVNFVEVEVKLSNGCCSNLVLDQVDDIQAQDGNTRVRFLYAVNLTDFINVNDTSTFLSTDQTYLVNFNYADEACPELCLPIEPYTEVRLFHLEEK